MALTIVISRHCEPDPPPESEALRKPEARSNNYVFERKQMPDRCRKSGRNSDDSQAEFASGPDTAIVVDWVSVAFGTSDPPSPRALLRLDECHLARNGPIELAIGFCRHQFILDAGRHFCELIVGNAQIAFRVPVSALGRRSNFWSIGGE